MNNWIYIIIPVFSALTGWLVVFTLFQFVNHPRHPRKIAGITIQGLLPKLKKQLPGEIADLVANELGSINISKAFNDPANLMEILPLIENHIDDFLRNKLPVEMPMIGMFVGDKTIGTLKQSFLKEMQILFPEVMHQYASVIKNKFDPRSFLEEKLASRLDSVEEKLVQKLHKEFRSARILGAFVGFVSGLLLLAILLVIT